MYRVKRLSLHQSSNRPRFQTDMRFPRAAAELNERFGIPGIVDVTNGNGGLVKISTHSAAATGELYLHGGQVTAWRPAGALEVLWVSRHSKWQDGNPIRGGVPICFPWFGPNQANSGAPFHGLVRARAWQLESVVNTAGEVTVTVSTKEDASTRRWWPHNFRLRQHVTFGVNLAMRLEITNTGSTPVVAQEALHTYFFVGDVRQVTVHGLEGVRFIDEIDASGEGTQPEPLKVTMEIDRLYLNAPNKTELRDPVLRRLIRIRTGNSSGTAVWNPWIDRARSMIDFDDDEWQRMICIETCNVANFALRVDPGQQHTMRAVVSVASF
jgi:glucose-6-phosphate 1-epimerase